jgi:hypothetical protein
MAGVSVLPARRRRLAALLRRLVGAALAAPEPPGKWSLRLSRRTDPGAEAAVSRGSISIGRPGRAATTRICRPGS